MILPSARQPPSQGPATPPLVQSRNAQTTMPPDARSSDRTPVHYTMKAPHGSRPTPTSRASHSHSLSASASKRPSGKPSSKPSTPAASPRGPYSVGQQYPPPKLSPARPAETTRATSPNYFGLAVEPATDPRDSSLMPRENWSSPSSSVRSFAAAIPKQVPLDANPDYEAFRRAVDQNRGKTFSLPTGHLTPATSAPRPKPPTRGHSHASDAPAVHRDRPTSRMDVDKDSLHDSAYVSADSKRSSEVSLAMNPPSFFQMPRYESPRQTESPFAQRTTLSRVDDRHPRMSVVHNSADPPSPNLAQSAHPRAETLPPGKMESGPSLITPAQLEELVSNPRTRDTLLLLDLRVFQQYTQAHIEGALNLCIPTTLLKRATFNLEKLQQTFQVADDQDRFAKWASTERLVVYDAFSSDKRDAMSCMNMIKKFANQGYSGSTHILRGGFNAFSESYPELVVKPAVSPPARSGSPGRAGSNLPPVIGGVMLPSTINNPNPFFSNIRQNMDLADGVGQMDIARPNGLESPALPRWLRDASKVANHGKKVSDKFLHIEKEEQNRMSKAYSSFKSGPSTRPTKHVQLSGVEKGGKNRYKDILPFEHARVKLLGGAEGACDYVNASHIKASRSNKRYIASQGPLPATFEDFWSVIWDQDVRVIVMLTAESEGGQLKCHPYWNGRDFGPIRLKALSEKKVSLDLDKHRSSSQAQSGAPQSAAEAGRRRANTTTSLETSNPSPQPTSSSQSQIQDAPYVILRKFVLSHAGHPFAPMREITHIHYPSWPDFGAPAQPAHLLALVELANIMHRSATMPVSTPTVAAIKTSTSEALPPGWYDEPESDSSLRPMLVHCSAGCGRTGTFCTVDSVIDMLKRQKQVKLNTKPVRKRDSDGDIKMSSEDEAVSPKDRKSVLPLSPTLLGARRSSIDGRRPPLDTDWLNDETVDLVAKTVEDFREQRLSMVQSLRQFVLCYETVMEYVWRLHEKSSSGGGSSSAGGTARSRARSGSLQLPKDV